MWNTYICTLDWKCWGDKEGSILIATVEWLKRPLYTLVQSPPDFNLRRSEKLSVANRSSSSVYSLNAQNVVSASLAAIPMASFCLQNSILLLSTSLCRLSSSISLPISLLSPTAFSSCVSARIFANVHIWSRFESSDWTSVSELSLLFLSSTSVLISSVCSFSASDSFFSSSLALTSSRIRLSSSSA